MVIKKGGGGTSSQAISHVTSGTYHRDIISLADQTWATGSEFEVTTVASHIVADDSRDALFSWIRAKMYIFSIAERQFYEYAVIRCDKDEALQDLDDDTVMENLHKQGRILRRDLIMCCDPDGGSVPAVKFELYNVKLDDDEELRMVVRPIVASSAASGNVFGLLEWREVGA